MTRAAGAEFDGRVVVVTGGSTGIGAAVVNQLAAAGACVVFCTHDAATIDADVIRSERVLGMVGDVRSALDMQAVVNMAVDRFGGLDGLVCSAGIQTYGTVEDTSLQAWHHVLDVNLTGVFLASKYALPQLRARGRGAIVAVSSIQARSPNPRVAGYSTSKAAVDGLVRSMAVDMADDRIRVNAVAPGPVATPLLQVRDPARPLPAEPMTPTSRGGHQPRLAQATEIAEVVVFLLGERSSYLTGTTVYADGGMAANPGRVLLSG